MTVTQIIRVTAIFQPRILVKGSNYLEVAAYAENYSGHLIISDQIKPASADTVAVLKNYGIKKTVMLTGDQDEVAQSIGGTGWHRYHLFSVAA